MNTSEYKNILVFVEQRDGKIQSVSLELISKAKELIAKSNQNRNIDSGFAAQVIAFVPGYNLSESHAKECMQYGADKIYLCNELMLKDYATEPFTKVVSEFINREKPESVLFGATTIGRDLAPRVSARLHTGLTADCTSLDICPDTGNLLMTRPAFGGNILATIICPDHRPQMSTVRPGVMTKHFIESVPHIHMEYVESKLCAEDMNIQILDVVKEKIVKKNITEANVLVSCGRGIGKKENLEMFQMLADRLGGMVSGSRAVVDAGWLEHRLQVGQTGQTVRPEVYFACGISGAIQHLAGMEESDLIIAINKNPNAPIFDVADLGFLGDVNQIIPLLIDEINRQSK